MTSIDPLNPWATPPSTHRRQPSMPSRVRPKSAMVGDYDRRPPPFDLLANEWPLVNAPRARTDQDIIRHHVLEDPFHYSKPLPDLPGQEPRHRSTKSFSSSFLPDIKGLARRMSNSLKIGSSKSGKETFRDPFGRQLVFSDVFGNQYQEKHEAPALRSKPSSKFWTPSSLRQRRSRPSLDMLRVPPTPLPIRHQNTFTVGQFTVPTHTPVPGHLPGHSPILGHAPIPGHGSEPPVLPNDSSGSAARASAAAQNEMLGTTQIVLSRSDARQSDSKLTRDSESGIGIDLRDRFDSNEEDNAVMRRDPMEFLPPELTIHILSFLDSKSVLKAGIVSRSWTEAANSRHVWKEVFLREYAKKVPQTNNGLSIPRGAGLGRIQPDQDWKKMFLVRRALDQRWEEGKAAAIYLNGHNDSVYCVQFDEDKIITGSRDQTIRVWDARSYRLLKVIGPPSNLPTKVPGPFASQNYTVHAPGQLPFTSISPPLVLAQPGWNDVAAAHHPSSDYHQASILCLQFDDEIMVTGSSDHTCIVWDIKNDYAPIRRLRSHRAGVLDVCFDDRYIVSCSKDTFLCVWDRKSGELLKRLTGHRGPVNAVQLRGDLVVSASGDGVAKLWNLTSGNCVKEFPSRDRGLACVEFSEDGRTILAGGNDQVIYQFDANTGELVNELKGHKNLVRSLHLDSSNGRVVSGSYDMSVKVFDFETGNLIIDFPGWTTSWMLSAKSDYRRIVATSQDSRAVIMDFGYGLDGVHLLES